MYSRTARVSIVRWNLKEAVGKSLVRRTEIAYKARLREMSWHKATKSDYYHICRSRVNAADIWRERASTLSVEVSQAPLVNNPGSVVTTNCEKSAEPIVVKKSL